MANIIPFRGIRYNFSKSSEWGKVLAPPYDVISPEQKRRLKAASPFNSIRLILGNPSHEIHTTSDYLGAKKKFAEWQAKRRLQKDGTASLYIYQQIFQVNGKSYRRTGFVGLSQLTPFGKTKGGILAHEHTLSGPKA